MVAVPGTYDEDLERCRQRVGTLVRGSWRLESLIGVGGMAAVYAASHSAGARVAIKILHPHVAISKELRARFRQEALAVAKLEHPATVQIQDVDTTDDGAPFMVMELLDGESLGQRAHRLGVISERELLGHVDTLLDVLAVAHERGIIHRDIKPDNLFVTRDGRLKVLDFGIARMREGGQSVHTRTGAMIGTTAYMAPEQIHARPLDGRADLFAVGATMFRVIAKRRIHEVDHDAALLMTMGSTPAPPLASVAPHVSPHLAKVVDRALAFDRDHRYPDARSMQSDVRSMLRGEEPMFASLTSDVPPWAASTSVGPGSDPTRSEPPNQAPPGDRPPIERTQPDDANRIASAISHRRWDSNNSIVQMTPVWNPPPRLTPSPRRTAPIAWVIGIGIAMVLVGASLTLWLVGDSR